MMTLLPADLVPAVNSEVRKVLTLPSSRVLVGAVAGIALLASVVSAVLAGPADPKAEPATGAATIGLYLGIAVAVVAGAMFGAFGAGGEFRHHSMAVTALFTTDRDRLAAAKFLVTGCFALATALVAELVAFGGLLVFGRGKFDFTAELWAASGGGLLAAVCWSLIGASAGILLRSSGAAAALLAGWIVVGEPLLWLIAGGVGATGGVTLLPVSATIATVAVGSYPDSEILAPTPAAVVVLLLWTLGLGAASWWSLRTRDI